MSSPRQPVNIALIGFMGTGKSSVGQIVAAQLHFACLDTDQLIESRTGKTVSQIFAQDGEPAFRDLERSVVQELTARRKTVISTGGGLPLNEDNFSSLRSHALLVCLWASPEKIWDRVRNQTHRPLLREPDPLEKIRSLLAVREPCYRRADILLSTEMRSAREVAQQVIFQFHVAQAPGR